MMVNDHSMMMNGHMNDDKLAPLFGLTSQAVAEDCLGADAERSNKLKGCTQMGPSQSTTRTSKRKC